MAELLDRLLAGIAPGERVTHVEHLAARAATATDWPS